MTKYIDCGVITNDLLLVAFKGYCALTETSNVEINSILNVDKMFVISFTNYAAWVKIFQNFLSKEFKDECLCVNNCNYYFTKGNNCLTVKHENLNFSVVLTVSNVCMLLKEFSLIFVHTLCLPDSSQICFTELLNFFSSLRLEPENEKIIKEFQKKDFIAQFQVTIATFNLNVSAVHIYCCLHKFKKDFVRLSKMRNLENDLK